MIIFLLYDFVVLDFFRTSSYTEVSSLAQFNAKAMFSLLCHHRYYCVVSLAVSNETFKQYNTLKWNFEKM